MWQMLGFEASINSPVAAAKQCKTAKNHLVGCIAVYLYSEPRKEGPPNRDPLPVHYSKGDRGKDDWTARVDSKTVPLLSSPNKTPVTRCT